MKKIALVSTQRISAVFNLDQIQITRKIPTVTHLKNGSSVASFRSARLPDSITFRAKERKYGLDSRLLQCTEIEQALKSGRLRVIEQPTAKATKEKQPQKKAARRAR